MDTPSTFAELEYSQKKKTTRREQFLARMDALIPWEELEAEIAPFYPRRGQGRPPYPLAVMLRVHCLQLFYNRSDPGMEDDLYEMESLRRFAGLRLGGAIPDETTILHFRHLLERHALGEMLLSRINQHLAARGLRLRQGTVVDSTLIAAPSSTQNELKARTRRCTRRARQKLVFRYEAAHRRRRGVGVGAQSGHHARPCARSDPGTGAAARVRTPGMGGRRLSGHPQAAGTSGPGRALARRPAAGGTPHLGPGQPGGAGGTGQILTAGQSGASVSAP